MELLRRIEVCYEHTAIDVHPKKIWDHLSDPPICPYKLCPVVVNYNILKGLPVPEETSVDLINHGDGGCSFDKKKRPRIEDQPINILDDDEDEDIDL